jgi:hypothetical protein
MSFDLLLLLPCLMLSFERLLLFPGHPYNGHAFFGAEGCSVLAHCYHAAAEAIHQSMGGGWYHSDAWGPQLPASVHTEGLKLHHPA